MPACAGRPLAIRILGISLATCVMLLPAPASASRLFDVDLDDRVDPVRPGDELVYEIDVENSLADPAPDTVVTHTLPPGTTFVAAYRQPDWVEIPAEVLPGEVRFHLGDEPSCGHIDLPACRDIWSVLHVAGSVLPGTVLEGRVEMSSSDPITYPTHHDTIYTSVGAAAIRRARVVLPQTPGRDRLTIDADLARAGRRTPAHPATPTLDPAAGLRIVIREVGGPAVVDVSIAASDLRCSGASALRCRLDDPAAFRPLGLDRVLLFLPHELAQRSNAQILVRSAALSLPDDFGPEIELVIESDGVTYDDTAQLLPAPQRLTYRHPQTSP